MLGQLVSGKTVHNIGSVEIWRPGIHILQKSPA